jgi:membrane fusion protein (multidrug efflux system)
MAIKNTGKAVPKKNKKFVVILVALVVAGGWFGISQWHYARLYAETDDAQIAANISPIIPRISGYISEIRVSDNQRVKKGDTLLILDKRDMQVRLEQAEAALATAQTNLFAAKTSKAAAFSNIGASQDAVLAVDGQIEKAGISVWQTKQEFDRYANLIRDHSITQQQYEDKLAAMESAEKQLLIFQEQKKQANSQTHAVSVQSKASSSQIGIAGATIKQRQVDVDDAKLNLSYAVITSPADGLVSTVNVQVGQFLTAGQSIQCCAGSASRVIAISETQYSKIRIGNKVLLR